MSTEQPRVLILGFGALGVLYGWLLSRGGAHVTAFARSNAQVVREEGVNLRSQKYGNHDAWRPDAVVSTNEEARKQEYDYILCTFKVVPELQSISSLIRPTIAPSGHKPYLILVQNGIGIETEPYQNLCVGEQAVCAGLISCCAWLGATLIEGGRTCEHGGLEKLLVGLFPTPQEGEESDRTRAHKRFVDTYVKGEGGAEPVQDIQATRWQKVLWNAAWGGLCCLSRQPVAALLEPECIEYTVAGVRRIMLECMATARSIGITEEQLPMKNVDDVMNITYGERQWNFARKGNLTETFKPSILVDLEEGRPMELSGIVQNIVTIARTHNIDTPRLELILTALRPAQVQAVAKARAKQGLSKEQSEDKGALPSGTPVGLEK